MDFIAAGPRMVDFHRSNLLHHLHRQHTLRCHFIYADSALARCAGESVFNCPMQYRPDHNPSAQARYVGPG